MVKCILTFIFVERNLKDKKFWTEWWQAFPSFK